MNTAKRGRCEYKRVVSACNHYITADIGLDVSSTITALVALSMPSGVIVESRRRLQRVDDLNLRAELC